MIQQPRLTRTAVFMDLENLLFPYREAGLLARGLAELDRYLTGLATRSTIVGVTVVCNHGLYRLVLNWLHERRIRPFLHEGGKDAADIALSERLLADVPGSCDTIVIASGDGRFLDPLLGIRASGRRVEVVAPHHTMAAAAAGSEKRKMFGV